MSRARTDQACLEAQMQQQIAQGLNAELAVPCPDCGVESGRACRDSLDRAVRTHLARSVAANRRDTEPCPAPTESLERASARAFAESLRGERPSFTRWRCPKCSRVTETRPLFKIDCCTGHEWTAMVPTLLDGTDNTPTASDCAPSPAASAPEAVASTPTRPVCACGQTIEHVGEFGHAKIPSSICERCFLRETMACTDCSRPIERRRHWPFKGLFDGYGVHDENGDRTYCNDCWPRHDDYRRVPAGKPAPLDQRIAETKSDDAIECAWSTPTSDGEGWR